MMVGGIHDVPGSVCSVMRHSVAHRQRSDDKNKSHECCQNLLHTSTRNPSNVGRSSNKKPDRPAGQTEFERLISRLCRIDATLSSKRGVRRVSSDSQALAEFERPSQSANLGHDLHLAFQLSASAGYPGMGSHLKPKGTEFEYNGKGSEFEGSTAPC